MNDYSQSLKSKIVEKNTIIENLKKTLERYEIENKALRELLKLWM